MRYYDIVTFGISVTMISVMGWIGLTIAGYRFKLPKFRLLRWFKLTFWHGGWQGGYSEG